MFTGIVESVGTVMAVTDNGAQSQIAISSPGFGDDFVHGESIAVDGVCLTVAKHSGDTWIADVMRVTRETTTLADVAIGQRVNLERAMRPDGRLGGHMMQGHVDGIAELVSRDSQPDWTDLTFRVPAELERYVVVKGSIALNGVSLTVAALEGDLATVSLIPTTLAETGFGEMAVGAKANVEVDVIGKYVEKMLAARS
ncbi:riboflavin synthase [Demequina zhanjiangensis]|uniref:Riboflavin synthase n=1 Tax=Demequina zhanjiangensis TaxID=3051659 RepID=A0ABT8G2F5_9MICO|nr:riboflavin synthase [Demequina sp. SYSU T00b26]MDN4473323.1 riboflavin synthase [Demequina sp. SYSU T00b26]